MKFSYTLLKQLAPAIKSQEQLVDALTFHAFEVEGIQGAAHAVGEPRPEAGRDTVDINIPANRYSDASSHYGMAVVISVILGRKAPALKLPSLKSKVKSPLFSVKIEAKELCPRYSGLYAELKNIGQSPKWMQDILIACGMRPINSVVDIMNYVMLEVGQPLHAFDYDKLGGHAIVVRTARSGEKIKTLDGGDFMLSFNDLVIADDKDALAVAGIKGGKKAEVSNYTTRIVVEAASFDAAGIYKTSRAINLLTDASVRFSHGLSPVLVERGIKRAATLLKEICGAKVGDWVDVGEVKSGKWKVIKFDSARFNKLTGLNLSPADCVKYLKNLGFAVKGKMVAVPPERMDISIFEDLTEEIVNIYGYDKLPSTVPHVRLAPSGMEDQITLKDSVRGILTGFGLSEVYNYSFTNRQQALEVAKILDIKPIALRNPISSDFQYLRQSLGSHLLNNLKDNLRFYDEVRIFEIGKVFPEEGKEVLNLGIALASKKGGVFLELKGLVDSLLKGVGLTDFDTVPHLDGLQVESGHYVIGIISGQVAELDLDKLAQLVSEEKEYRPLPKYPSVMRDISIIVGDDARVGDVQDLIENASHILEDVDLLDWYEDAKLGPNRKSLTFRLVFQAEDRTLTDEEVGKEMEKIVSGLEEKFGAEIR